MEMPDVFCGAASSERLLRLGASDALPAPAVLMFSILPLSLDNVTSPAGSGVAGGDGHGDVRFGYPPPPGTGGKGGGKRQ